MDTFITIAITIGTALLAIGVLWAIFSEHDSE